MKTYFAYEINKAIVRIPESEMWKLSHGIILPTDYKILERPPWFSNEQQSWNIVVEGPNIPPTSPAIELPYLQILPGYQAIIVIPWET